MATVSFAGRSLKGTPVATLALAAGLLTAVLGAIATGTPAGGVNAEVEGLSVSSGRFLGDLSDLFPLGFAFAAGMVSAANPCGFPLLPAYLGFFLSDKNDSVEHVDAGRRLWRALLISATVTSGFVLLFAGFGLSIGSGAHFLVRSFPWVGLGVGIILAIAGAYLLRGGQLYSTLGERLASRIGGASDSGLRGYFLFGLSYGTASLSCTLPIFLIVVGSSITASELLPSLGQFVLYSLGMGAVITALTISVALFKSALVGQVRRVLPYIETVGAVFLIAAGSYIVYYWLTLGGLLDELS